MRSKTKFFIILFLVLAGAFMVYYFSSRSQSVYFDFGKMRNDMALESIVSAELNGKKGKFAVYIEELEAVSLVKPTSGESKPTPEEGLQLQQTSPDVSPGSSGVRLRKYVLNEKEFFPAASLYKLVLLAAALKEVEAGRLKLEDTIIGSKSDLTKKFGTVDFGYEDFPENFEFTVEEILERIGRISDNFAAIMLTERLRNSNDPLTVMAKELGMEDTIFDPPTTTASDIALFLKEIYLGKVVSKTASEKIIEILSLSQLNNRIPAKLPENVKVVHKTGELPYLRHDAGIVFPYPPNFPNSPYLIILLSKDLELEDEGVEVLANISKGVWDYFSKGD